MRPAGLLPVPAFPQGRIKPIDIVILGYLFVGPTSAHTSSHCSRPDFLLMRLPDFIIPTFSAKPIFSPQPPNICPWQDRCAKDISLLQFGDIFLDYSL
jgi:hypothetical protein